MEAVFDANFLGADLDHDDRISDQEAVAFFKGSGLPQLVLTQDVPTSSPVSAYFLVPVMPNLRSALATVGP